MNLTYWKGVVRSRSSRDGFTLLELLIVLAILGLLAWLATPPVLRYLESGRVTTTRVQVQKLSQALGFYSHDVGQYPTTEKGLAAFLAPAAERAQVEPALH